MNTDAFVFDFASGPIKFGRGIAGKPGTLRPDSDTTRVMVISGSRVGQNPRVREPIVDSLGEHLTVWFDETTKKKNIETAYLGLEAMLEADVDALVGVGGGSSLDVATVIRLLYADYRPLEEVRQEVAETGRIALRADHDDLVPLTLVPTTFAGADLSTGAGIAVPTDDGVQSASVIERPLMPNAVVHDPDLFESTPFGALAGSAMNGFNKGIEALYSRHSTPITDATARHGLAYLSSSLPRLPDADAATFEDIVVGMILVQYGVSVPERMQLAILHAFGHAFRDHGVQQGRGHAAVTPEVLRYVFDEVDGRRELIADGLGVADADDLAAGIVEKVTEIRDGLNLPTGIRELEGVTKADLPSIAASAHEDHCMANSPSELDPTVEEVTAILEAAW
jgi:alcohol dehydrogenase